MNTIKSVKLTRVASVVLAVVFGVMFVSLVANAVTTISTAIETAGNITTSLGSIEATAGNLTVGGTTTLGGGTAMSEILFGYCTLAAVNPTTASTTYALCTGAGGAASVTSAYRVFVQATSSLPVATVVTAASSTVTTGVINIRLHGNATSVNIPAGTVSLQVWAVR